MPSSTSYLFIDSSWSLLHRRSALCGPLSLLTLLHQQVVIHLEPDCHFILCLPFYIPVCQNFYSCVTHKTNQIFPHIRTLVHTTNIYLCPYWFESIHCKLYTMQALKGIKAVFYVLKAKKLLVTELGLRKKILLTSHS